MMELEQLYYLGEMIGVVIVAGSLIFVGVQMRQNANALRVSATAASVANWQVTVLELAGSAHLAPAITRLGQTSEPEDFSNEDVLRVTAFLASAAKNAEFAYYRHQSKEIDDGFWDAALNSLAGAFISSTAREVIWPRVKLQLSPDFAAFMDTTFAERPSGDQ